MLNALKNRLRVWYDPEMKAIARIIREMNSKGGDDLVVTECNKVFVDRLRVFPIALKMDFWEHHFELEGFSDFPEIGGDILDFGCGSGHLDVYLARRGFTVTGVDLSPVGIAIASFIRENEAADVKKRLLFFVADVTADLPPRQFDAAWSAHVFEHIKNPGPVLAGLKNWIKPGGSLLISVPFGRAYDDPGHVNHFYSEADLQHYLGGHISVERIKIYRDHQVIRALCKNDGDGKNDR
ncbi:Methyltransferase type 11 [Geobacter metallireducens RCH3]|uniref:SAM-dependent methyltransferase, putative n=1 Tax=Geobacter metallireducens (strain ATCC 53774 / DSM 7210 / GS-15) TaxID=269799 RepID=Q39RL9_GEOMG|nr:class I SAM-dependent methyltransferase [Geobacter metallireducens]ABB33105.1 SAM-dependent methyltransferase, putative [Geobacter metallireducens GS-15]EHP87104.1 Methyltransferase type 11 [Geobacter metallireducens RCH3]